MKKTVWNDGWTFSADGGAAAAVTLPHDASQIMGRAADAPAGTGGAFYQGGRYEYRKTFVPTESEAAGMLMLEVEGAYPEAEVFLNGEKIGTCEYGYLGYFFDLSGAFAGQENIISIQIDDTKRPNSRWYSGAGLYRNVNLHTAAAKAYIHPEGIRVRTISIDPAVIEVQVLTGGALPAGAKANLRIRKDGAVAAEAEARAVSMTETENKTSAGSDKQPDAGATAQSTGTAGMTDEANGAAAVLCAQLTIPDAALWDAESPVLYSCEVELTDADGTVLDCAAQTFGIRTVTWSADGLFINGNNVLLKGGCLHHDNGVIGARSLREAEYRKIARMKAFGFNAIRSSHNPASKALLEACDTLGMYVMDEGWDMWYRKKTAYDYSRKFEARWREDVKAIVARDYSHPSVIMYSIGNEVTEPAEPKGVQLAGELADAFRAEDPTRAVTAGINITLIAMQAMGINLTEMNDESARARAKEQGINSTKYNEMAQNNAARMNQAAASDQADALTAELFAKLDIAGYNYADSRYPDEGAKHPERIVVGSETYAWQLIHNWPMAAQYPYLIGDFMWTAWDYIGENGIGAWTWEEDGASFYKGYPWKLGDTGAIDLLGNDTAEAGQAAVIWGAKDIYVGVVPVNHEGQQLSKAMWRGTNALPHWSYRGCDGQEAQVEVYGGDNAAAARLFVNGKACGQAAMKEQKAVFRIPYESGELRAEVLDAGGAVLASQTLRSADGNERLRLTKEVSRTDEDIFFIDIDVIGDNGEIECNLDQKITVEVEGGELLGFGSANPKTAEEFSDGVYTTWYGRSLAVVRRNAKVTTVKASGEISGSAEVIF